MYSVQCMYSACAVHVQCTVHVQCMYSVQCTVHVLHLGGNALIKKAQSQEMQRFQAIPPETDSKDALALTLFFSTLFSSTR
jgi:hypothetical protein